LLRSFDFILEAMAGRRSIWKVAGICIYFEIYGRLTV
jgi:hypothetical protein